MAAIKVYLDEDVHPFIAQALRLRGWEALTTVEAGQRTADDEQQLTFAATGGYVLLTYNSSDFPRLHAEWLGVDRTHAGIIVAKQDDPRRSIRALLTLVDMCSAETMVDRLEYLSNWG